MKRKPKLNTMAAAYESIIDRFERATTTANLIAAGHESGLATDETITQAAFHLFMDLSKLKRDVEEYIDAIEEKRAA